MGRLPREIWIFVSVIAVVTLVSGNNCGDTPMRRRFALTTLSSNPTRPSYLATPDFGQRQLRLVLFIDMSQSMFRNPCPGDIDSSTPKNIEVPCDALATPSDGQKFRLKAARKWLNDFENTLPVQIQDKIRVLIVPFTGGVTENLRNDQAEMSFRTIASAKTFIAKLIDQQNQHDAFIRNGDSTATQPNFMGTSVPGTRLAALKVLLQPEIDALAAQDALKHSNFQVVFISDGNPKPTVSDVKNVIERIWTFRSFGRGPGQGVGGYTQCISQCRDYVSSLLDPLKVPTGPFDPTDLMGCDPKCVEALNSYYSDAEAQPGSQTSPQNLFSDIAQSWGDFSRNRAIDILQDVLSVRNLFKQYSEAQVKYHFAYVNKFQPRAGVDPLKNWIILATSVFKKNTSHDDIVGPELPKNFFPEVQAATSFMLESFMAINLNLRVDRYGQLSPDSDGDGLLDYEENANEVYTSRSNGFCLDGITKRNGCMVQNCDPSIDADGDSLNECEEITLGTDAYDFDSDGDGIPDSIEVLFGLDPMKDDRNQDLNNDGISNFENFRMGLAPNISPSRISDSHKVLVRPEYAGTQKTVIGGVEYLMAGYITRIQNIPIATMGAGTNNSPEMFYSRSKSPGSKIVNILVAGDHGQNQNRILLLGLVKSTTSTAVKYWVFKDNLVSYAAGPIQIGSDLSTFATMYAKDPEGEAEP